MKTMLTIDEVADRYPHILVADLFRLGYKVGADGSWRWDRAALETHLALAFDPQEWVSHNFTDEGKVELSILDETAEVAVSFTPSQAQAVGLLLIKLAYGIDTQTGRENGIDMRGVLDIMRVYDVDYIDEVYAAMMRRAIHEEVVAADEAMFGPGDDNSRRLVDDA